MAHKILEDGRVVVDWTTGDPEGDRINLLAAYRDLIIDLQNAINSETVIDGGIRAKKVFEKWKVSIDNQVDEVPRIWIKRPE